jgi:hypothetical protein
MKHLERLKKMVNWAHANEWIDKNPFAAFRLRFKRHEMEFLDKDELARIDGRDLADAMLRYTHHSIGSSPLELRQVYNGIFQVYLQIHICHVRTCRQLKKLIRSSKHDSKYHNMQVECKQLALGGL